MSMNPVPQSPQKSSAQAASMGYMILAALLILPIFGLWVFRLDILLQLMFSELTAFIVSLTVSIVFIVMPADVVYQSWNQTRFMRHVLAFLTSDPQLVLLAFLAISVGLLSIQWGILFTSYSAQAIPTSIYVLASAGLICFAFILIRAMLWLTYRPFLERLYTPVGIWIWVVLLGAGAALILVAQTILSLTTSVSCGQFGSSNSEVTLIVNSVDIESSVVNATLVFSALTQQQQSLISQTGTINVNNKVFTFKSDGHGNFYVDQSIPVDTIEGHTFFYPYGALKVVLAFDPSLQSVFTSLPIRIRSRPAGLALSDIECNSARVSFSIGFSLLLQIMFVVIALFLGGLLAAIWVTKSNTELIQLAVGSFAAVIAIRSFLVPFQTTSLLLIDLVLGVYIPFLLILLIYKHFSLRQSQQNPQPKP